jgi:hypothetical protein
MIVYRAMSEVEFNETMKSGKADFSIKRFKWFSPSLNFIVSRVRDGKFNNSKFATNRYTHIVEFDADVAKADWHIGQEIQFDRRRNARISAIQQIILDKS